MAEENREKVAKVSKGRVVKKPAQVLDRFKSSLMMGIKGPTPVMEGLKQKEISTIAENSHQLVSGALLGWSIYLVGDGVDFNCYLE